SGIIEQLPVGVSVQNRDGKFLLVNDLARRLLALPDGLPAVDRAHTDAPAHDLSEPAIVAEECTFGPNGEGAMLRLQRSVRLNDDAPRLSAFLDITERKHIERQLARRADFDELTGLPNRSVVEQHVELLIQESNVPFAVAFLD